MKFSRLRSAKLPLPLRRLSGLLAAVGSLQLAVVLIAVCAAVLAWATLVEKKYGAAAAHFGVYDTGWFLAINVILAVNVLCAALIRFPWKWRQTGFLVMHLGILVLLAGCLVSRQFGIEGQLSIYEGRTACRAYKDSHHFELQVGSGSGVNDSIRVPFVAGPFSWKTYNELSWFPWRWACRSQAVIYDEEGITLEVLDYTKEPQPSARVRLTVDSIEKEFDVAASSDESLEETREQVVAARHRRVAIAMRLDEVDLGFQLFLHNFRRKLDPGGGMASHYSSLVDFLDRSAPPRKLVENVLITLNEPMDFADPLSGRTYRLFQSSFSGPWTPGEPEFDPLAGKDRSRDQIYLSQLSVNYDPGREMKYIGCFMIVVGIIIVYYLRAYFVRKEKVGTAVVRPPQGELDPIAPTTTTDHTDEHGYSRVAHCVCSFFPSVLIRGIRGAFPRVLYSIIVLISTVGACHAEDGGKLDWSVWQHMPVFGEGRVVPLDTFARETVEAICGRANPTLELPGKASRTFTAAELLLSWLAEPEKWDNASFLPAEDEQLRQEVLGLGLFDAKTARRLRCVSPSEVENNVELGQRWAKLQKRADAESKDFRLTGVDKKIKTLVDAYGKFRLLTFDPNAPKDSPQRFYARVQSAADAWRKLAGALQAANRISRDDEIRRQMIQSGELLQKLLAEMHGEAFSCKKVEKPAAAFSRVGEQLAARLADSDDKPLVALAADLRRQTTEMHLAMYDNGETLRLVPALNPGALEENREPSDDAAPWLSFQAMISGSDDLMRPYPQAELKAVSTAWTEVKTAYRNRDAVDRPADFAVAMNRFAEAVRKLGKEIEPLRQTLPVLHRDQELIEATAYPPPGSMDLEVFYNRLDPFFWSWVVSLAATVCLSLAVGPVWKPMFWLGVAVLVVAQACTAAGLGLRGYITGLVPLTGMFETVVFVALYAALLGLWFTLRPLLRLRDRNEGWAIHCPLGSLDSTRMERVRQRRLFAVAGAIVSFVAAALAYYAPSTVMHRNIGSVAPILRDNYWLAVHVVTIMASYASAAIALILGNIALGHYLFGRYADRRPPEACAVLAGFIYAAIQITVLLLAAGTILGALWADKAWGRFWAWDPKEVWALISLLVYLLFLHARHIGWSGDFGTALMGVLGAAAILCTWYGVNFLMGSGMHSYGSGAGGQWQVALAMALQGLFVAAAAGRYLIELGRGRESKNDA